MGCAFVVVGLATACNLASELGGDGLDEGGGDDVFGGQTGDGTGNSEQDTIAQSSNCGGRAKSTPVKLSSETKGLPIESDVLLSLLEAGVDSSARWAPNGGVTVVPAQPDGRLKVRFETDALSARLVRYEHAEDADAGPMAEPLCDPYVELATVARIEAGDEFDQVMPVTVRASRPGVVGFSGSLAASLFGGPLELKDPFSNAKLHRLEVQGVLSEWGSTGYVSALFASPGSKADELTSAAFDPSAEEGHESDSARALFVWPVSEVCTNPQTVPVRSEVEWEGRTLEGWSRLFDTDKPLPVVWSDTTETQLALRTQSDSHGCMFVDSQSPEALTLKGSVSAESEDGRLDVDMVATFWIASDAAQAYARLELAPDDPLLAQLLPRTDFAGGDLSQVALTLSVRRELDGEGVNGSLALTGLSTAACEPGASGRVDTASCNDALVIELLTGRIGDGDGAVSDDASGGR